MRRSLCLALGLGALMAAAGSAHAQATIEGAAKLKAVLEAWHPSGTDLTPAEARYILTRLRFDLIIGSWLVEPDGNGYRIRTPGSKVMLPEEFESVVFGYTILACDPEQLRAAPAATGLYTLSSDGRLSCRLESPGGSARPITAENGHTSGSIDPGAGSVSVDTTLDRVTVEGEGAHRPAQIDRLIISGGRKAAGEGSDVRLRISLEGVSYPTLAARSLPIGSWPRAPPKVLTWSRGAGLRPHWPNISPACRAMQNRRLAMILRCVPCGSHCSAASV